MDTTLSTLDDAQQALTYEPPTLTEYGSLHTLIRGAGSQIIDGGDCAASGDEPDTLGFC